MNHFMIARSNIRKNKNMTITLIVLIIFATILLYIGTSVILEMNTFLDNKNEELNGSDFTVFAPVKYQKTMEKILDKIGGYNEKEDEKAVSASATFRDITTDDESQSVGCLFQNADHNEKISKLKILDQGDKKLSNSIIVPYFLKVAKGYHTGDKISVTYEGKAHTFIIYGFAEDILFAVPTNLTYYKCYVFDEEFNGLYKESENSKSFLIKTLLPEGTDTREYQDNFVKEMNSTINDSTSLINAIDYDSMKTGGCIFFIILMVILITFSMIIILIALTVIRFAVVTYIEGSIKNIGSMEALGYTGRELIYGTVLQFALITLTSNIIGLITAFSCTGIVKKLASSSIGLVWSSKLNLPAVAGTILIIMISVIAISYITASKIKKITPVIALRSGVDTHNFRKNHFPLGEGVLNVNVVMGFKILMYNMKQNITILIIITLMSFVCVFSFTTDYNFVIDNTAFLRLIGIEKSQLQVICVDKDSLKVFNEIGEMEKVKKTVRLSDNDYTLYMGDNEITSRVYVCNDYNLLETKTIIKGRYPIHDNEIAVTGLVLKHLNAEVGDVVTLKGIRTQKDEDFIIVGVTQHITNLGNGACITEEGMKRIDPEYVPSELNVYLDSRDDIACVTKEIEDKYPDLQLQIIDLDKSFDTLLESFNQSINQLCIGCIIITLFIISLVLYLLIKIRLIKERMRIGISKGLGYTTKQLILQVICSFSPICIVGALIGTVSAIFLINPLLAVLMSFAGILNCHFLTSPMLAFVTFISISLYSTAVTALVAGSVRKITPCELFG